MFVRHLRPRLLEAISDTPVVFIQGPRQCGKTTLACAATVRGRPFEFRTFDRTADRAAAEHDPDGFVDSLPPQVILDEVQRVRAIFPAIKRAVDADRRPGRFLLTGADSPLLLPAVSESLTGRMEILTLRLFSRGELLSRREVFVDSVLRSAAFRPPVLVRGGFPGAVVRQGADRRTQWFESYLASTIEKDVRDLGNLQRLRELPMILRLSAARSTTALNLSEIARAAEIPLTTMQRIWALLEATLLVATVPRGARSGHRSPTTERTSSRRSTSSLRTAPGRWSASGSGRRHRPRPRTSRAFGTSRRPQASASAGALCSAWCLLPSRLKTTSSRSSSSG